MGVIDFFKRVGQTARNIGHRVNHGFNNLKHHVRRVSHRIGNIAGVVREAMTYFNDLPFVGQASSAVGSAARVVQTGANVINRGFDKLEEFQRYSGMPTHNRNPLLQPPLGVIVH